MRSLDEAAIWNEGVPGVDVPGYDRTGIRTGIVHIGVGGFHRAHLAMYVDSLLIAGEAREWGICGVGVLPGDARMRDVLRAQEGLYTLVRKEPDGSLAPRVVGSLVDYLFAPDDPEAVIERIAHADTRIVSLTITEGGYAIDQKTGEFDPEFPGVRDETSAFGLVVEALARRRDRGTGPLTIMSCDNMQGNGDAARRVFTGVAQLRDPELGAWVADRVSFPNSMVDRITPATADSDREALAERFGLRDGWPVVCEPFTQWVLEDDFAAGRPEFERVDVQVVDDVVPYEFMKLRLLNATHQALGYLGYLAGHRYVHEVAQDPVFARFLRGYMDDEATPTLRPVPGIDLDGYKDTLIERFANPGVADTLMRINYGSSDRISIFLLPVVREQLAAGGPVQRAAAVVAGWCRYAEGTDEQGAPIEQQDRLAEELTALALRERDEPLAFLRHPAVFGDLADDERFATAFRGALESLYARGAAATVADLA
ncbi:MULTISPECIES: mannitol dehydrogenase family protein [Pseudonocardia]|uniref:Mannitol-1-phosphate 5-dehydrogenase n=2 Tax=Pseudonocardia TaxID=1847 RepID=A0A1Y2N6S7_PSEAH|nr:MULTISPECIES: mannitol dehydrogenase family protein [Pseudonocardia]OSY43170.1 Mannitol 2-dehydrogenase [Pseudonocardia autotrophica]TDN71658.1 mannitol 2-dehydrogenase [Pseudonocardia autotrophica]BBG02345.1 mannitol 2-dehydrogenase [Pseudonocardia autotrophica]GEC23319.1 mannitol 2-dehydrogenase [Pseudonocardia saturnea]